MTADTIDPPPGATDIVDQETAQNDFDRFCESWDIDTEFELMDEEDKNSFNQQKNRIIREIKRGKAAINENGDIEYKLVKALPGFDSITFCVPTGAAYMSMDRFKDRQSMHKLYAFMGEMAKCDQKFFAMMNGRDVKFCMGVATLFLGS